MLVSSDRDTRQFKLGLAHESRVTTGHLAHFSNTGTFCPERSGTQIRQTWQVRNETQWQGCVHEACVAALNPSQYSRDITRPHVQSHGGSFGSRARRQAIVGVRVRSSARARCQLGDCCWKEEVSLKMELWGQACSKPGGYGSERSCIKTS